MPQIEVRSLLEKVNSDKYTDRRIEITSDGGPIINFNLERRSWIDFRVGNKVRYQQPISGYFFAEYPTHRIHGLIDTITCYQNHQDFSDFEDWAQPALGFGVQISEPVTLLKMTYVDTFKRNNNLFVLVSGGSVLQLSESTGKEIWDNQSIQAEAKSPVDLSHLKNKSEAASLLKTWKLNLAEYSK